MSSEKVETHKHGLDWSFYESICAWIIPLVKKYKLWESPKKAQVFFFFFLTFFYIPFFLPPAQYNVGVKMHGLVDEANLH